MNSKTALEYMHDSIDHLDSLLKLFDLGYIDLEDRSNAEILANLIIKKAIWLLEVDDYEELKRIDNKFKKISGKLLYIPITSRFLGNQTRISRNAYNYI